MDPFADDPDDVDVDAHLAEEEREAEVAQLLTAFASLIRVDPRDAAVARLAVEAVVRAALAARGPEDPTPGMMSVPALAEDPLVRAQLADAAPACREVLGDLERLVVAMPAGEPARAAARLRAAIRAADARLGSSGHRPE